VAYSVIPKTKRDGKITLKDGTGSPVTLEVEYEEGNITFDTPKDAQTVIRDRGVISTVRRGDSEPVATGSFNAYFRQFTDGSEAGSILDFINQTGHYGPNISTGRTGTPYVEFYCITLSYFVESTDLGDDADTQVDLTKCVCTASFAEGDPSSFTINFTSYGPLTYT